MEVPTDVILFNIDERADNADGRGAILSVFQKVLNELEGYSKDFPHIANMERHLSKAGKLEDFKKNYREKRDNEGEWEQERKKYLFHKDQLVEALEATLDQSKESCEKLVQGIEGDYTLTVQSFVECVKDYLDSKGSDQRIFFIADEVGQFIADDTQRMLNLQTIVESLNTKCGGQAWIFVTSQANLEQVIGSNPGQDFSRIQDRFTCKISLEGNDVSEVIQLRLLQKKTAVQPQVGKVYEQEQDNLRTLFSFDGGTASFPNLQNADHFVGETVIQNSQFRFDSLKPTEFIKTRHLGVVANQ